MKNDPNLEFAKKLLQTRAQGKTARGRDLPAFFTSKVAKDAVWARAKLIVLRRTKLRGPIDEYSCWVDNRLGKSGLAQRLPDGLNALPDIYEHMPWYLKLVELPLRPRDYSALLLHMYAYLDWYLDPRQRIYPSPSVAAAMIGIGLMPIVIAIGITSFDLPVWMAILLAAIVPMASFLLFDHDTHYTSQRVAWQRLVNIVKLEEYLSKAYSEP